MANEDPRSASALPARVIRYGVDRPLPQRRLLRAGPLSAVLENGDLRYVKVGDQEVVRRLYMAVRNQNWDTIEPRFTAYEVADDGQSFHVRFTAEHVAGEVDFAWEGTIAGTSAGVIRVAMDGVARHSFLRNRIGFCVLHPMDLAGTPVETATPDGPVAGAFPTRISPHQPFVDMMAITHPIPLGGTLTIRFEGDLFEMEDQRNWTDASYKTYSTPLRIPYPVRIDAGQRVRQIVTIEVTGVEMVEEPAPAAVTEVGVGADAIGPLPPLGLGVASHGQPLIEAEIARLRALRPAHLRVALDVTSDGWDERLRQAAAEARALDAALEIEALTGDAGEGIERLVALLAQQRLPVARLLVFPRGGMVTTEPVIARARQVVAAANVAAPVGGGSRAYFTELNRATLPLALMDVVGYTLNPQVHAFDNASLVETLAAQGETVASAKAIAGERPLAVGPVTLAPRFNPNATGPVPAPAPGELPPEVDVRQLSLFGAGWTLGSIRHLVAAGADSLTYYETTGWRGVMERAAGSPLPARFPSRPGMLFPVYHVLADLAELREGVLLPVTTTQPLAIEALALRQGDRVRVLLASFADEPRPVRLTLPGLAEVTIRSLDETTAEEAMTDGAAFRQRPGERRDGDLAGLDLTLPPFAVVRVDGRLTAAR